MPKYTLRAGSVYCTWYLGFLARREDFEGSQLHTRRAGKGKVRRKERTW